MNTAKITGDFVEFPPELYSYSTAKIEKTIFFGETKKEQGPAEDFENAQLLVVNGEMYQLIDNAPPELPIPPSSRPALVDILNLDLL